MKKIILFLFSLGFMMQLHASGIVSVSKGSKSYSFSPEDSIYYKHHWWSGAFEWNFGDGNTDNSNINTTHVYASAGVYIVSLTITDSLGISVYPDTVCVTGFSLVSANNIGGISNNYSFLAANSPAGSGFSWYAEEPDSFLGTDSISTFMFRNASAKNSIKVLVASPVCMETVSLDIDIKCDFSPAKLDADTFLPGDSVRFELLLPASASKLYYTVDFGDSTAAADSFTGISTAFSHLYSSSRYYLASATVSDANCSETIYTTVIPPVKTDSCKAEIYWNTVPGTPGIRFGLNTFLPAAATWHFGDGGVSSVSSPTYTYRKTCRYYSPYVVLDYSGACPDDTLYTYVYVQSGAWFSIGPDTSNTYAGIIYDRSVTDSGARYHWDFGDGDTSDLVAPSHIYSGQGPYLLCLTVYNANCSRQFCDTIGFDANGTLLALKPFSIIVQSPYDPKAGVAELETGAGIRCYPNPAEDIINVEYKNNKPERISVYSMDGRQIFSKKPEHDEQMSIQCDGWDNGVYIVKAEFAGFAASTLRVVKY